MSLKISEIPRLSILTGSEIIPVVKLSALANYTITVSSIIGLVTKNTIGLDLVDNTPDLNKPISVSMNLALANKSNIGHTHTIQDIVGLSAIAGNADVSVGLLEW